MNEKALTLQELAQETGCQLIGNAEHSIRGVAELHSATIEDASFVSDPAYLKSLPSSKAGVVFIAPHFERPTSRNYLLSDDPKAAFQKVSELIETLTRRPPGFQGIHQTAVIHETARIAQNVHIGPHAVIERDVIIGEHTTIGAGSYIGPECSIGQDTHIHPNVTLYDRTEIGLRVVIESGTVIGSSGFGYRQDEQGKHQHYPHLGNVVIEDDVEIGANNCIDRARLKSTRVRRGTKIDNLVQIAHNVDIGEDNILVAQVGIAGSSQTGRWCVLAGRAGLSDHVKLCDKVVIAACSAVAKDITTSGTYIGLPAIPIKRHHRLYACFHMLDKMVSRITKLRERVTQLEKAATPD